MERKQDFKKYIIMALTGILIAVVVIGTSLSISVNTKSESEKGTLTVDTRATAENTEENVNPLASRNVYFAGIEDSTIKPTSIIELENLSENEDFLMKYTIKDASTQKVVFETDLIPSGEHINWVAGEDLEPGTYDLLFLEEPYALIGNDYIPLTAGQNKVTITIIE